MDGLLSMRIGSLLLVASLSACGVVGRIMESDSFDPPAATLWTYFEEQAPAARARIDHGMWDKFLRAHVVRGNDGVNALDYARVASADRKTLNAYIGAISRVRIRRFNRNVQLPYWINLYNAMTVKLVLDHYPVDSIRDIDVTPGEITEGPWSRKLISVEGVDLSLDDIEHRILRPIWKDPRIHYALTYAAAGGPNLQPRAFDVENTEELLEWGAREYVNHPRGIRAAGGEVIASRIYSWYRDDFGGSDEAVLGHVRRYAMPELQALLARAGDIDGYEFSWALNGVKRETEPLEEYYVR